MARLRKLILGLGLGLLLILLAEVGVRAVLGPPAAGVRVFSALGGGGPRFAIDGDQVRKLYELRNVDPVPTFPRAWEGNRVAVLGESSVHGGSALRTGLEFPGLLEKALGVPVVNLATPGLDSFDLVEIAEDLKGMAFSALVVYAGHNDVGNTWFSQRYGSLSSGLALRVRQGLDHLSIFSALRRALSPPEGQARAFSMRGEGAPVLTLAQRAEAAHSFELNLRRIVWLAQERGMTVILAAPVARLDRMPLGADCVEPTLCARDEWRRGMEATDPAEARRLLEAARDHDTVPVRATSGIIAAVQAVAEDTGAVLVDLEASLPADPRRPVPARGLFVGDDPIHLSAAGHQAFAEALEPVVRDAVMRPR